MESEKRMYTCAVCGKKYDNIKDRMNCERKCIEELTKKNEEAEKAKAKAEKTAKEKELNDLSDKYNNLLNEYINKYNEYPILISKNKNDRYYTHVSENVFNSLLNNFLFRNFF